MFCILTAVMLFISLIPFSKYDLTKEKFQAPKQKISDKFRGHNGSIKRGAALWSKKDPGTVKDGDAQRAEGAFSKAKAGIALRCFTL